MLYEKITTPAGRVTYREHQPAVITPLPDQEITTEEVVTIMTTLVISMLMSISGQLQPHEKLSRETKLLEKAVLRYASLNGAKLCPEMVNVGVGAWNEAIQAVQRGLAGLR